MFVIILIGFISVWFMNIYAGNAYLATLSGTYRYSTTLSTDSPLSNLTLFIPVPEDRAGNSPIVSAFSAGTVAGIPAGWTSALYYTGKTTVIKITVPSLIPPAGTTPETPFFITLAVNTSSKHHLETLEPIDNGVIFRPVQNIRNVACPVTVPASSGSARCYEYETPIYADYLSSPGASVSISSDLAGKNSWDVFGPHSNEYRSTITLKISGQNHGWAPAKGILTSGIGTSDEPRVQS